MKRFLKGILGISSIALLMLASCKKEGALVTTNGGNAGSLTPSTTTPVLEKSKVNDTAKIITFSFTPAQYTFSAAATNTLQIDAAGDNWKNPTSVSFSAKTNTQSYNTADFNKILLKLNLTAGVSAKVNVRMQYALSTAVNVYSNVTSLTVTPFNLTSYLYVPGDYEGWKNDVKTANAPHEDSLISVTGNGIYVGIIDFRGYPGSSGTLQYKLVPIKGDWSHSYGTFDTGTNTTIVLDGKNDGNLWVPTAAPYLVTVNLNNNTISAVAVDWYSVIGSAALGWGTDTEMKFVNDGSNLWVANNIPMTVGEYKFRQDDAWSNSWGPGATAGTVVSSGATGDGNIQLTAAGNYNLTLLMPPTPFGTTFLATTTFTAVKQ